MSGDRKEELRSFLDSMVDGNQEQAQVHFHNYLEDKMKNIVNPPVEVEDGAGEEGAEVTGEEAVTDDE